MPRTWPRLFEEFASLRPDWLRQASLQLDDKVSIVTLAELDDPGKLAGTPAFQRFRSTASPVALPARRARGPRAACAC